MNATRFVILHHRQSVGEHWDFMIEQADSLATWQLLLDPIAHGRKAIPAVRLGAHRKAYLTYQGPISGHRGDVTRVEQGDCEILETGDSMWRFRLYGRQLAGLFELTAVHNVGWIFRPAATTDTQLPP